MKTYQLYYSLECDSIEAFEIKKFINRNKLNYKIDYMVYRDGKDGVATMTHLNDLFFKQLADQSVVLPLKLRYFLLIEKDTEDMRSAKFVVGKDNIISYLQENLV